MKIIRVVSVLLCVGILSALVRPQLAHAERIYSEEHTITITARVLEHRTIIVDANGNITQISSNTENNITPDVHFLAYSGPESLLTLDISRQYQHLMGQLNVNHIMVMDRKESPISGFLSKYVLTFDQKAYTVSPTQVGDGLNRPYMIYE